MRKLCLAIVAVLSATMAFSQGVTTASLGGKVTDTNGEPLIGATILAVHVPSNTTYGAAADFDGFYRISGMRTGGPYKISFSYTGFAEDAGCSAFVSTPQSLSRILDHGDLVVPS